MVSRSVTSRISEPAATARPVAAWRAGGVTALLLGGAFLAHLAFVSAPGWEWDVDNFVKWTSIAIDRGVAHIAEVIECIYPPGFLYLLKGTAVLWLLVAGGPLPAVGSFWARFLAKLFPVLANLATAWVLYRLALAPAASRFDASHVALRRARVVLAAYAFNPAMLFISAVWGQADSLIALLLLLAACGLARRRFALGFALAAAAVLVKPQAGVVWPALLLLVLRLGGLEGVFAAVRGASVTALVLLIPYFVAYRMDALLTTIGFGANGLFPNASLNAHNVWWLVLGADARFLSDSMRFGNGLLTYAAVGALMFALATGLILWRLWRDLNGGRDDASQGSSLRRDPLVAVLEACALQIMAFYLFPTEIHDRYNVPALGFLAALCIWRPRMWWLYGTASLATLLSLASTLNANYPQGMGQFGMLIPAALLRPDRAETLVLSAIFLALFVVLLLWTADKRFRRTAPVAAGVAALAIAFLTVIPLHGSQQLSHWRPVEQSQGWGDVHYDRSVGGNRLSVASLIFRHGIGTHAASKLTYHLNGAFRTFDTSFGIDDEANIGQRIRFRIWADGEPRFDSGDMAVGTPGHARVSVAGARFLTLEVLDGGDGIDRDHADWLEPVLLR